jgi:hypothetical protein
MPSVIISNYKRPGIFIQEYDNSVIASQTAQGLTNLVIGVSKTGPINTPVLIQTTQDLQNIFGGIDRTLERKGSYFQRTIAQMIQSSPVYAINLLETDDTLDQIEYAPLSTATNYANDEIKLGAYRRFFNTTGFWNLDTDSFISLTKGNANYEDRLLNFTNTSASYITVFVFKTTATGFDVTFTNWYSSVTNIPPYVYPTDYVSDYMVDVVVMAGDWSNYQALAVDKTWSKYFDASGLIKGQVQNFINDRNVTLLKYYQGLSFIPYFRDSNNQNIFIETVINQDTNTTGLFCAFNMDAFETDFPTGKIDLIGNNLINSDSLIDSNSTSIDFLSYNETLVSTSGYTNTLLDRAGNVLSIDPTGTYSKSLANNVRTDTYAEERISGVFRDSFSYVTSSATVVYTSGGIDTNNGETPYVIIGGNKISISGATSTFTVNATDYASASATASYYSIFKLDTSGSITKVSTTAPSVFPSVATTDIVLGYLTVVMRGGNIRSAPFVDLAVDNSGYVDLQYGTDYVIENLGVNNTFKLTFTASAAVPSTSNYAQYRRIKRFNSLRTYLESTQSVKGAIMLDTDGTGAKKYSLSNMDITAETSTSVNKSITIQTNLGLSEADFSLYTISNLVTNEALVIYNLDNELILSDNQMITSTGVASGSTPIGDNSYGIVAKYSTLYQDFYNGNINTGDYFYANAIIGAGGVTYTASSVSFVKTSGLTASASSYNGFNFLVISGTATDPFNGLFGSTFTKIIVPDSLLNKGTFNIKSDPYGNYSIGYNYRSILGYGSNVYAYLLTESVTAETLYTITRIWDASSKYYLSMNIDSNNDLTVDITGDDLYTYQGTNTTLYNNFAVNSTFNVNSFNSDYQQSVEIDIPAGYTSVPNQILVNATRYSNVIVGDFLLQDNTNSILEIGQQAKNLTRIISKKVYSEDTSLVLITCDAAIFTYPIGSPTSGVYQTMRYASLDNYISTYKAIPLKGFRIRQASLPDGTEAKQDAILNLVAKGTPLFNAITNKDALDIRYLIDSFGLGLIENSKQQLADICGARLDCLGFLNMPSMKQFRQSSSPSFVDAEGVLQTSYIAQGGNLDSNPAFLYSMAEGNGTTCVGYFTPYVTVSDNGSPLSVPPAMFVATTYMRKHNSNVTTTVPWTIAAGTTNGLITGIAGVEMDFNPSDLDNLNQAQFNPIVLRKNRGWVIDTENTALTLYKSALSYLHVREVLIELERDLAAMLLEFQWKFNTQDTRTEIKLRADVICAGYVNKNGLYNYFNKCDSENNTSTLIDNQIGVLDTYVEPIRGLAVIVNNITVLKTGAIQSGGFQTL